MKNNTTHHTTLNIRYMWARTGIEFMKLCCCQGTLNPDFHQKPVTSEPKKTARRVGRCTKNSRKYWTPNNLGMDSKATT